MDEQDRAEQLYRAIRETAPDGQLVGVRLWPDGDWDVLKPGRVATIPSPLRADRGEVVMASHDLLPGRYEARDDCVLDSFGGEHTFRVVPLMERSAQASEIAVLVAASLNTRAAETGEALKDVAAERERQITGEGWTPEHDDTHSGGELALAAACYAFHAGGRRDLVHARGHLAGSFQPRGWPWDVDWWKPKSPRHDLIRAAALLVAEIERIDRAALSRAGGSRGG